MNNKQKALDLINAYLEKQNKTKLASQKVELALVDDLDKEASNYFRDTDSANGIIKGLLSDARKAESKIETALKSSEKLPSIISKFEKSAKEIGVDVNNISEYKSALSAVNEAKEYKQVLSTIKKFISSI